MTYGAVGGGSATHAPARPLLMHLLTAVLAAAPVCGSAADALERLDEVPLAPAARARVLHEAGSPFRAIQRAADIERPARAAGPPASAAEPRVRARTAREPGRPREPSVVVVAQAASAPGGVKSAGSEAKAERSSPTPEAPQAGAQPTAAASPEAVLPLPDSTVVQGDVAQADAPVEQTQDQPPADAHSSSGTRWAVFQRAPQQARLPRTRYEPDVPPSLWFRLGQPDKVVADLNVSRDGSVTAVSFVSQMAHSLQRVVQAALLRWEFEPAEVEQFVRVEVPLRHASAN